MGGHIWLPALSTGRPMFDSEEKWDYSGTDEKGRPKKSPKHSGVRLLLWINLPCPYLFDNVELIWSVVKQGVKSIALWKTNTFFV